MANRLAIMPKCGDSILRLSWGLCLPSHAVPRAPIVRKRQDTTNKEASMMVAPSLFLSPSGTLTGLFQGARQRKGRPSPHCAQPGLSQRYRLHMHHFSLRIQLVTSQLSMLISQSEERRQLSRLSADPTPEFSTHIHIRVARVAPLGSGALSLTQVLR